MSINSDTNICDGTIADGLTDNWTKEDKRKFVEDWLDDSSLSDLNEIENNQPSDGAANGNKEDTESEENFHPGRKRHRKDVFLDSESQGNDSEVSSSATPSLTLVNPGRRKRKKESFLDSESQGNDSELSSSTTPSFVPVNPAKFRRVRILDSQSQEDSSEIERPDVASSASNSADTVDYRSESETSDRTVEEDKNDISHANTDDDDIFNADLKDDSVSDDVSDSLEKLSTASSSHEYQPLENDFYSYVHYMLHRCLDPLFSSDFEGADELKNAKDKIEAKLENLESMLRSEAWQIEFRETMETFPVLEIAGIRIPNRPRCEACARPGRIASRIFSFTGSPYDMNNFESKETMLQPSERSFEIGKYCARRSKLYHRVFHYSFKLREKCVEAVNEFSKDDVTTNFVFEKCSNNLPWLTNLFDEFCSLRDDVTEWFYSINKYQR